MVADLAGVLAAQAREAALRCALYRAGDAEGQADALEQDRGQAERCDHRDHSEGPGERAGVQEVDRFGRWHAAAEDGCGVYRAVGEDLGAALGVVDGARDRSHDQPCADQDGAAGEHRPRDPSA
jgi:hypothetical protein